MCVSPNQPALVGRLYFVLQRGAQRAMFLEHIGLVDVDAYFARQSLQHGPLVVYVSAVDAIVEDEVHAGPPEAKVEVVIVVPESVHELLIEAPYLFDGPSWHTRLMPRRLHYRA